MNKEKRFMKQMMCIMLAVVFMVMEPGIAYAGTYAGGFTSGKQRFYVCYNKDYISLKRAKQAVRRWNGVSSNVKLAYQKNAKAVTKGICVSIGINNAPKEKNLGLTTFYYNGKRVNQSDKWDRALCVTYANEKHFDTKNCKAIRATTTHEVGHALSLSHSTGDNDIMKQGPKDYTKLSNTDKDLLKKKWGK